MKLYFLNLKGFFKNKIVSGISILIGFALICYIGNSIMNSAEIYSQTVNNAKEIPILKKSDSCQNALFSTFKTEFNDFKTQYNFDKKMQKMRDSTVITLLVEIKRKIDTK